jgi:hypothetical protein
MLKKVLIIAGFIIYSLAYSVSVIIDRFFDLGEGYHFDVLNVLGQFILTILVVAYVVADRAISIRYKYLAVAMLLYVFWNTFFYYLFIIFGEIDIIFVTMQNLSYLIFMAYGLWKAYLYKTKK